LILKQRAPVLPTQLSKRKGEEEEEEEEERERERERERALMIYSPLLHGACFLTGTDERCNINESLAWTALDSLVHTQHVCRNIKER